jgi:hypothetical protein
MSVLVIPNELLSDEFYVDLVKRSVDMGVMVAINKNDSTGKNSGEVYLFFLSHPELWRIPAYISMKSAFSDEPWSNGVEILERTLHGYSENQAKSWISEHERKSVSWLGLTCYFVVSDAQRDAIRRLRNRCIDPSSLLEDIEVFYNTDNVRPKENVHKMIPEGMNLCRAAVKFDFFKKLFAQDLRAGRKIRFFVSDINSGNVDDLNESLQTNFQFFDSCP